MSRLLDRKTFPFNHHYSIEIRQTTAGPCGFRQIHFPLNHQVGYERLTYLRDSHKTAFSLLAPDEWLLESDSDDLLFLDIETTGLGGAGAMTFLVATGRLEYGEFVLRQYLALSPPQEPALLEALLEDTKIGESNPVLVTYNGRRFDAPMLDGRAIMHRQRAGFESLQQLDLLPAVRTAYRGLIESCRLTVVETELLGLQRSAGEVSGADSASWYFRYLRSGDYTLLIPLIQHNELDVMSLAALTGWLALSVSGQRQVAGRDALAIGRLLMTRGHERATEYLERAMYELRPSRSRDNALTLRAILHKRSGRRDLACPLWETLAERTDTLALNALVELAMYHEHQRRDFQYASALVDRALHLIDTSLPLSEEVRASSWKKRLLHRKARLSGKQSRKRMERS